MPRNKSSLLNDLSTADLKRLLAARERIDVLEGEKSKLVKELTRVENELAKLLGGVTGRGGVTRKKTRKKKTVKKQVAKKPGPAKHRGRKPAAGKPTGATKMKLEDVIVAVIRKKRSPIAFQDLKARIVKGRLFKTKSGNFDNVLRRTLSTSKMVKRVGRGIYDVA